MAALKGITIEIGGNTTKLSQALKSVNSDIYTLRSSLKDVEKGLQLDPTNVDLLNQKQRILTQTISSTEEELKILKKAQQQYIESGKNLDGKEYTELEKKIAITEKALKNLHTQQNNFNGSVQAMGLKLESFGQKATQAGSTLTKGLTAPIVGVGTAATAAWKEIDSAYDSIAAGTGATGSALSNLQDSFDRVYGDFPASTSDVASAIADINTRFGLLDDELEDASTQFLKYARVNNTDVSGSIEKVAKAMSDARIDTKDLNSVLDRLTVASQASGMSVDVIAESLSKNGYAMRELGYSTDETIALLTTFEKQGVDTSTMLTAFKTAVKNCGDQGKDAKAEISNFFESVVNGTADATTANELFGKKAGAAILSYAREGKLNISDMMATIAGSAEGLNNSYEEMFSEVEQNTIALNNLKLAGKELGESIMSALAPTFTKLAEAAKKLAEWFKNLSDTQKDLIVKIGLVAAAAGPLLLAVGKLSSAAAGLIQYFGSLTTIGGKLLSSLSSLFGVTSIGVGALAGLVAGIAAVAGAFVTLWNTSEDFRNRMVEIWNSIVSKVQEFCQGIVDRINELGFEFNDIVEVIQAVWMGFCDFLAPVFEGAWKAIEIALSTALDIITGIVDVFIGLFTGDWEQFWSGIREITESVWNGIGNLIQTCIDTIVNCVQTFLSWFGIEWDLSWVSEGWSNLWNGLTGVLDFCLNLIKSALDVFISIFTLDWDGFCGSVGEIWTNCWNAVRDFASNIWNTITSFLTETWNNIVSKASEIFDGVMRTIFGDAWDEIKRVTVDVWNTIWETLTGIWNSIVEKCQEIFGGIADFFGGIWNTITGTNQQGAEQVKKDVEENWKDLDKTTQDNLGKVAQTVDKTWKDIDKQSTDDLKQINKNVSQQWKEVGSNSDGSLKDLTKTTDSAFKKIRSNTETTFKELNSKIRDQFKTMNETIQQRADSIKSMMVRKFNEIQTSTAKTFTDLGSKIKSICQNIQNDVTRSFSSLPNTISSYTRSAYSYATSTFNNMQLYIGQCMNNSVSYVSNALRNIQNLFANFRINYPHIAVPHFSISPRGWQLGDLLQGSIPSLSIQWYAKAMSKGMILDGATIFGMQNGQLLGGGEAGKEAVVGLNSLESMIDASVDRSLRAAYESYRPDRNTQPSVEIDYDRLAQAMISGLGEVTINNTFAIGSRQIANEILPAIDKGLERRKNRR